MAARILSGAWRRRKLFAGPLIVGVLVAGCGYPLQPEADTPLRQARQQVQAFVLDMTSASGPGVAVFADPYVTDGACTEADGDSAAPDGRFAPYQDASIYALNGSARDVIQRVRNLWRADHFTHAGSSLFDVTGLAPDAWARSGDYTVGLQRVDSRQVAVETVSECLKVGADARPYAPLPPSPASASLTRKVNSIAERIERALVPGRLHLERPAPAVPFETAGPEALSSSDPWRDYQTAGATGLYAAACLPFGGTAPTMTGVAFQATFRMPGYPDPSTINEDTPIPVAKRFSDLVRAWQKAGPTLWQHGSPSDNQVAVTRIGGLSVRVTRFLEQDDPAAVYIPAYQLDISTACP